MGGHTSYPKGLERGLHDQRSGLLLSVRGARYYFLQDDTTYKSLSYSRRSEPGWLGWTHMGQSDLMNEPWSPYDSHQCHLNDPSQPVTSHFSARYSPSAIIK